MNGLHWWAAAAVVVAATGAAAADEPGEYTVTFDANGNPDVTQMAALQTASLQEGDVLKILFDPTQVRSNAASGSGQLLFDAGQTPPDLQAVYIISQWGDVTLETLPTAPGSGCAKDKSASVPTNAIACVREDTFPSSPPLAQGHAVYRCPLPRAGNVQQTLAQYARGQILQLVGKRSRPNSPGLVTRKEFPEQYADAVIETDDPGKGGVTECHAGATALVPLAGAPKGKLRFGLSASAGHQKVACTTSSHVAQSDAAIAEFDFKKGAATGTLDVHIEAKESPPESVCVVSRAPTFAEPTLAVNLRLYAGTDPESVVRMAILGSQYNTSVTLKAGALFFRTEVVRGADADHANATPYATTPAVVVHRKDAHSLVRMQVEIMASDRLRSLGLTIAVTPVSRTFFRADRDPWTSWDCVLLCGISPMVAVRLSGDSNSSALSLGAGVAIFINKAFQVNGGFLLGTQDLKTGWRADCSWFVGIGLDPFLISEMQATQTTAKIR